MNIETKHLWSHKCPKKWDQYTLIALVITIVILIIFAGVTIKLTLGNNGLFNKAKQAADKYYEASQNEENELKTAISFLNENSGDSLTGQEQLPEETPEEIPSTISPNIYRYLKNDEDLKIWIGSLESHNATIQELITGELLDRLMNSETAVNYMISNERIMNLITSNESTMQILAKSDYAAYKVLESNKTRNKILSSPYVSIFDTTSTTIPTLSSDTNVFYSSCYSTGHNGYKAFDNDSSTWWWSNDSYGNEYVGYNFDKSVLPYKIKMVNLQYNNTFRCKDFKMQSSNLNENYSDITDTLTAQANYNEQTFNITTLTPAQYVRFYIINNHAGRSVSCGISELQVYCREMPNGNHIDNSTNNTNDANIENIVNNLSDSKIDLEEFLNNDLGARIFNNSDIVNQIISSTSLIDSFFDTAKIFNVITNSNYVDTIIANNNVLDKISGSRDLMNALGKSKVLGYKVIMNNNARSKILSSSYVDDFDIGSTTVPTLSSDTNVFYSNCTASGYSGYKVFDKDSSTWWRTNDSYGNEYVGYNFGKNIVPYKIKMINVQYKGTFRCKDFKIQSSSDNASYNDVTNTLTAQANFNEQIFNISTFTPAQYVKFYLINNYAGKAVFCGITELQIYCRDVP